MHPDIKPLEEERERILKRLTIVNTQAAALLRRLDVMNRALAKLRAADNA
jgi:hypothetical protein